MGNANPFDTSNGNGGSTGNGNNGGNNGGKFNTIGRSNPFSSAPNHQASKNPFLDQQTRSNNIDQKITSSGEDVNDSPDSSLEPEDNEIHDAPSINKIETSFASNQPVTRSLSSVTSNNKSSKLPLPTSNGTSNGHSV